MKYVPSKCLDPITLCRSITSQKNGILCIIFVCTSLYLVEFFIPVWTAIGQETFIPACEKKIQYIAAFRMSIVFALDMVQQDFKCHAVEIKQIFWLWTFQRTLCSLCLCFFAACFSTWRSDRNKRNISTCLVACGEWHRLYGRQTCEKILNDKMAKGILRMTIRQMCLNEECREWQAWKDSEILAVCNEDYLL